MIFLKWILSWGELDSANAKLHQGSGGRGLEDSNSLRSGGQREEFTQTGEFTERRDQFLLGSLLLSSEVVKMISL